MYPLKFDLIYKQIIWGGTNISRYFRRNLPLDRVAESWELCCRYGVKKNESKEDFLKAVSKNKIEQMLNMVGAKPGDVFYVPTGKVHAIFSGILIAEIQQNSNTTYRIYGRHRVDKDGKGRTLNTSTALDVIDFNSQNQPESYLQIANNQNYCADAIIRSEAKEPSHSFLQF